jgi:hypothetical protein
MAINIYYVYFTIRGSAAYGTISFTTSPGAMSVKKRILLTLKDMTEYQWNMDKLFVRMGDILCSVDKDLRMSVFPSGTFFQIEAVPSKDVVNRPQKKREAEASNPVPKRRAIKCEAEASNPVPKRRAIKCEAEASKPVPKRRAIKCEPTVSK